MTEGFYLRMGPHITSNWENARPQDGLRDGSGTSRGATRGQTPPPTIYRRPRGHSWTPALPRARHATQSKSGSNVRTTNGPVYPSFP
jgi:hypothetical protein